MPLGSGDRLGPYQIESFLGAGGMGEVYRARDTRLNRVVAIKVLPSHLSTNSELKQRLEREARAISCLQHANICVLHDVGHEVERGIDYLVFEYLEGETLLERLRKGPISLPELVRVGAQIADALDRAHGAGIVHRDLKPANVMLTKSGAKLLDFGLAKSITFAGASNSASLPAFTATATMSAASPGGSPITQQGMIVGTFNYMSPEQVQGQEADGRSDVFAFGAVLYEMATGKRAFDGKSQLSVASAILDTDPEPITVYQKAAPAVLEHVIQRALEKDPENRWQSVRDMKVELQWMLELPLHPASSVQTITTRRKQEPLLWVSLCIVILALAGVFLWKTLQQPQSRVVRFTVAASEKSRFGYGIAISPDGSQLCLTISTDGKSALALRALDSVETRPLSNTTGGDFPFWSPDGRALGFFADGKLKRIDLATGATQVLADAVDSRGGSWGSDGDILFAPSTVGPLMRVRAAGGPPVPATKPQNAVSHRWPQFLPDGKHFLYLSLSNINFGSILEKVYYSTLGEPEGREITESSSGAQYASGHLLYIKGTSLLAQPFKAESGKVIGEAISVADGIRAEGEGGPSAFGNFTVSGNGVLVFNRAGMRRIQPTWFDFTGKRLQAIAAPGDYDEPALSPDGTRVVLDQNAESGERNVYVLDLARGTSTRVSLNVSKAASPIWSPDGKRVAFRGGSAGERGIYTMSASGAGAEELISKTDLEAYPDDWSPDGKLLLFEVPSSATNSDLWLIPLAGERKAKPLLNSKYNETHASFSSNSHWIAYSSDESGRSEIYVQSFPDLKVKLQISTDGGDQAYWSRDEKKLFYLAPDRTLMFVKVNTGGNFQASSPSRLFQLSVRPGGIMESRSTYAIANDGKRILVMEVQQTATSDPVVVVNWTASLNK